MCERVTVNSKKKRRRCLLQRCLQTVEIATSYLRPRGTREISKRTMNYIFVKSVAAVQGPHQGVFRLLGPTYIEYYAKSSSVTSLDAELIHKLLAQRPPPMQVLAQWFFFNYTVNVPPLAILEFLKQHGYQVVGTNTIGLTCIWTLEKQTGTAKTITHTTKQSKPKTK